jgi:hypothetical protein
MLQQATGCSVEQINQLSGKIQFILENILELSHEDKSNKIEMLRKIESKLFYMAEKRDYIASKPKAFQLQISYNGHDLYQIESQIDKERKETKRRKM